ncbi:MAG: hypothetical protein MO846_06725 [Candidatus Devosia symbiotica]|nr:hypothetical protein [Candidatus Devosia symbiotica]
MVKSPCSANPPISIEFPNSKFVAGFIGSVNMVDGVVTEDEAAHVHIRSEKLGCDIYVGHGVDCAPGQRLI